jgi:AraC family transcriptional regulator, regulatory protein of adaptative response / DNA-3-methyladenine glycosylase II
VQLILGGALDEGTEQDLGARLGVSARHLRRLFAAHIGATPDQVARSRRAHFARRLLDDTDLTITAVAFASGFGSVRQLNRACMDIFRATPGELRARRRASDRLVADGGLLLRLPYAGELDWAAMASYLAARAIPGVEHVSAGVYRRTIVVDGDPGVLELSAGGPDHLLLRAHLPHWEGLIHVVERARRLANLDADVEEGTRHLADDPTIGDRVVAHPGLRVPGTWDPFEIGVRAIIGQQVTVAGATTIAARLVQRHGTPVGGIHQLGLTHTFPAPATLAGADLGGLGLTDARAAAILRFAAAVDEDAVRLDGSVGLDDLIASIIAIPGLGPWTAQYIGLRVGERDAFPAGDLGLRRALGGPSAGLPSTTAVAALAERWRPWRALAAVHLWAAGPPMTRAA